MINNLVGPDCTGAREVTGDASAPHLSFVGPAGRTELIRGQAPAAIATALSRNNHAVLAYFGRWGGQPSHDDPLRRAWLTASPCGPVRLVPAHSGREGWESPANWRSGDDCGASLAVFLPTEVLDACGDGPDVMVEPRGGDVADPEIWATLCKIKRAVEQPDGLKPAHHDRLLYLLAAEIAARHAQPAAAPHRGGLSARQARLLKDHLAEHHARQVSLTELAALVRLNRSHLCEAFRQSTGLAPHQFQTAYRIDRAKQLLSKGGLPLAEIALAVGYSDQSQFGAMFRKVTGSSPGQFRRQVAGAGQAADRPQAKLQATARPLQKGRSSPE